MLSGVLLIDKITYTYVRSKDLRSKELVFDVVLLALIKYE